MRVLSINFGHDASLALFVNGELIQFEELERSSRLKHQFGVQSFEIKIFLGRVDISLADINFISICSTQLWIMPFSDDIKIELGILPDIFKGLFHDINPNSYMIGNGSGDRYKYHLKYRNITSGTTSFGKVNYEFEYIHGLKISDKDCLLKFKDITCFSNSKIKEIQEEFFIPGIIRISDLEFPTVYVNHHFCHANYADFYSEEEESLISTHDGGQPIIPFNSGGIFVRTQNGIIPFIDHRLPLCNIYNFISKYTTLNDPGKLMGLSSYAIPNERVLDLISPLIDLTSSKNHDFRKIMNEIKYFGGEIIKISTREKILRKETKVFDFGLVDDLAIQASANTQLLVQDFYINTVGNICNLINKNFPQYKSLNLTGGFTLNCPTNSLLSQKFINLNINPLPGCGDTGLAIGAGIALHRILNLNVKKDISHKLSSAFPPFKYDSGFLEKDFKDVGLKKLKNNISVSEFIANAIIEKKILCIFRGRSEVGPRALGNRSIIATATSREIRDEINIKKGRELWRPLAPICRYEDYTDYFDGNPNNTHFMLFTNKVKSKLIEGVTHVDGTARVQTITEDDVWLYHALTILKNKNEVPVIINTSFNCAGEPIVETYKDAFKSFSKMNFDFLISENGIFRKIN
jgi:carbamoyltransferase